MTLKTCLRCDWEGETKEPGCPSCGGQSLYVVGASPSGEAGMAVKGDLEKPSREAASTASMVPSGIPSPRSDPSPSSTGEVEPSSRSDRSVVAFALAALVLTVTLGSWLKANEERSAPAAPIDAAVQETPASGGSPTPTAAVVGPVEDPPIDKYALTVDGVPFSFSVPTGGWESFGRRTPASPYGSSTPLSINKSIVGSQGAEAIIFWSSFPDGDQADPCTNLLSPPVGPSAGDLAAAVAAAPGTELVSGPSDVTVGGRAAKHVVLTVREDAGCDPGFFYTWRPVIGGALWPRTNVGDTIRVWIVDVDGTRLFIEAETHKQATPGLEQEIQQIVGSIRFGRTRAHTDQEIAERFMEARNAYDAEKAMSLLAEDGARAQLMYDNRMDPDMFTVRLDRDELALALEAERLYAVRYGSFACQPGPDLVGRGEAQVICTYLMDNKLRQIDGLPPVESSFAIRVRDDRITYLSFPWLNVSFDPGGLYPAEFESFVRWLEAEHPEAGGPMDRGELFETAGQELILILTRESLDLLAGYLEEYERSVNAGE